MMHWNKIERELLVCLLSPKNRDYELINGSIAVCDTFLFGLCTYIDSGIGGSIGGGGSG